MKESMVEKFFGENEIFELTNKLHQRNFQLLFIKNFFKKLLSQNKLDDIYFTIGNELKILKSLKKSFYYKFSPSKKLFLFNNINSDIEEKDIHSHLDENIFMTLQNQSKEVFPNIYVIKNSDFVQKDFFKNEEKKKLFNYLIIYKIEFSIKTKAYVMFYNNEFLEYDINDLSILFELKDYIRSSISKIETLYYLKDLNFQKNELIGIIVHDLRNPLMILNSYLDIIDEYINQDMEKELILKKLQMLRKTTWGINKLIDDITNIYSLESINFNLQKHEFDLINLFFKRTNFYSHAAKKKEIQIIFEEPDFECIVNADKIRIAQVIDNLLSNAIKYTEPGGRITIYFEKNNDYIISYIKDTGQGLNEDDLKNIFIRPGKLSSRPTGNETQSGYGLVFIHKIIDMHNGRIWVNSKKGEGSIFAFSLPLK